MEGFEMASRQYPKKGYRVVCPMKMPRKAPWDQQNPVCENLFVAEASRSSVPLFVRGFTVDASCIETKIPLSGGLRHPLRLQRWGYLCNGCRVRALIPAGYSSPALLKTYGCGTTAESSGTSRGIVSWDPMIKIPPGTSLDSTFSKAFFLSCSS